MSLLPFTKTVLTGAKCRSNVYTNVRAVRNLMSKELIYNEFGDPLNVVKFRQSEVPPLNSQEVLVRMLAAPVNPADINTIQGKNVKLPCLPSVGGDEGVGEVCETGNLVSNVKKGDRVVLSSRMLGSWRYYGIFDERDVHIISPNLPLPEAAMLAITPCMAYRMLKDYRHVLAGQTVLQSAANSACGQCVIQLCRNWGIKTMNIVANHCQYDFVKAHLLSIGADTVLSLEEAEDLCSFDTPVERPVLALNCLGGRCEDVLLQLLQYCGTIVYYGCAYNQPISKHFIRSDATFCRFHLNNWDSQATVMEKDSMLNEIIQLMVIGCLKAPNFQVIELKDYLHAFRNTNHCDAYSTANFLFDLTMP